MSNTHTREDEVPDHEMVGRPQASLTAQESVSGQAEHETEPDVDEPPTANELRLAQRVLELERERDSLAVSLPRLPS